MNLRHYGSITDTVMRLLKCTSDQLSMDQAAGHGARLQRLVRGGAADALQRSSGMTTTSSKNDTG